MKYQLALQFPANSITDYDDLIAIEDALITELGDTADVDGHDCGSGEMNIFIFVNEPEKIFETIRPVLAKRKKLEKVVAAYRETDGEEYTTLWPIGFHKPFKIT
jgi:uncharacterized protein DUF695